MQNFLNQIKFSRSVLPAVWFLLIFTLVLGIFGFIGSIFSLLVYFFFPDSRKNSDFHKKLFSAIRKTNKIFQDLKEFRKMRIQPLKNALDIVSYNQIMDGNDMDLKIGLISLLSFNPAAQSVGVIRRGLKDEEDTIRILCGTSLQKMDDWFVQKIMNKERMINAPGAKSASPEKQAKTNFELACLYRDYLASTLVGKDSEQLYIEKMKFHYESAISLHLPSQNEMAEILDASIRFCLLEWTENLMEFYHNHYEENDSWLFLKARFFWQSHQRKEIRNVLSKMKNFSEPRQEQIRNWWLS